MSFEPWEERSVVVFSLNQSVDSVSISLDWSSDDSSVLIFKLNWLLDALSASVDGFLIKSADIVNSESDIFHTISVVFNVLGKLGVAWVEWWLKSNSDFAISNDVSAEVSVSGFKTLLNKLRFNKLHNLLGRRCTQIRT